MSATDRIRFSGCDVSVVLGDIMDLRVEAIVNPANNKLRMGGGLALRIRKRGGRSIEVEAMAMGPISVGASVVSKAGRLGARYVIHAATMAMDFETDEHKLRSACRSALEAAVGLGVTSIAVPALGCGTGKFPPLASAKIIAQEVLRILRRRPHHHFKQIIVCVTDRRMYKAFSAGIIGYLKHFTVELERRPFLTVDVIIEVAGGVVLIERSNPPFGWALPGGFVDEGETLEKAAAREAKEETGLKVEDLRQFHTYSDPGRDPRFHTVTTVFSAYAHGAPHAGDDAKRAKVVGWSELCDMVLAFDHRKVLEEYVACRRRESAP